MYIICVVASSIRISVIKIIILLRSKLAPIRVIRWQRTIYHYYKNSRRCPFIIIHCTTVLAFCDRLTLKQNGHRSFFYTIVAQNSKTSRRKYYEKTTSCIFLYTHTHRKYYKIYYIKSAPIYIVYRCVFTFYYMLCKNIRTPKVSSPR